MLRANGTTAVSHSCETSADKRITARAGFLFSAKTSNIIGAALDIVG